MPVNFSVMAATVALPCGRVGLGNYSYSLKAYCEGQWLY